MSNIDFYFDFLSPYAYLASSKIEQLAARHGRTVTWRPFRLGVAVVKVMGLKPLMETPLKGAYLLKDLKRLSTVLGEPLDLFGSAPDPRPAGHLFYAAPADLAASFAKAVLKARWDDGLDIADSEVLVHIATGVGMNAAFARTALSDQTAHEALAEATQAAIGRGVFGSPTCAVGDELFWGVDRLWLLEHYLTAGERYVPLNESIYSALGLGSKSLLENSVKRK